MKRSTPRFDLLVLGRRELLSAGALAAFVSRTAAVSTLADGVSVEALEELRVKHRLPALGAGIVTFDGLAEVAVTGFRKSGDPTRAEKQDQFHLGSCTKAITAALIGRMVEQGKLRWTTTVAEGLPFLNKSSRAKYAGVTVEHLLAHRSGLPDRNTPPGKTLVDFHRLAGTVREQREKALEMIFTQEPAAAPGAIYAYSNAGYMALGAMAEYAAGKAWEDLVIDQVCKPLGMTTVGYGSMGARGKVEQPWQHRLQGENIIPVEPGPLSDNPPAMGPAGRMHCCLADWALFLQDTLRGDAGRKCLLKPETYQSLRTPKFGGEYAGGWIVVSRDWAGGRAMTHAGSNTMNYAVAWLAPLKGFAVFAATNIGGPGVAEACDATVAGLIQRRQAGS